jgi:hypothetical protein
MADDVTRTNGLQHFLDFIGTERRRALPSVRENLGVLTSRAGLIARMPFSVSQETSSASVSSMVKNKPNRPLNQSFQQGCARPRYTTVDNISAWLPRL